MKLLIADDHPLVRRALSLTLERVSPGATVIEADSLTAALRIAEEHPDLDLFLMDLFMPDSGGLDGLVRARMALDPIPVAVVSADETASSALGALDRGAMGYLPKSLPEDVMRAAMALILAGGVYVPPMIATQALHNGTNRDVAGLGATPPATRPRTRFGQPGQRGLTPLTPRQQEVLDLVIEGLSNREIAERLSLAEATVKVHITAILRAYGVNNRTKAISAVRRERTELGYE